MLGALTRIAGNMGALRAGDEGERPGDAATALRTRIPNVGYINGTAPSNEHAEPQLNAFRGTIYAAVDKIARRVAQLKIHLYQYEHTAETIDYHEITVHPFVSLFSYCNGHRPHEEYNVWELMYWTQSSLDLTGEAWWLVERDDLGRPARVTPLPASRMTIVFDKDTGTVAGYAFTPKGTTVHTSGSIFIPKLSWEQLQSKKYITAPFMAFFRYPSPRGIEDPRGWSPVKAAAYAYDINTFEQIYKRNFLEQGAQLGGILQSEVALTRTQIDEYIEQFNQRHGGYRKAGLPIVLPKMLKWTTTEPTPRDIQWVETIKATESQILQIYGISDAKLGRADIGNRNTADAMDVTFNREVIQSRTDMLATKMNTDFVPVYPMQTDTLYFSACFDDPIPADGEAQMKREAQDLNLGIMTPNEKRQERGLKPFGKYGDMVYKPLTAIPVDPWGDAIQNEADDAEKNAGYGNGDTSQEDKPADGDKPGVGDDSGTGSTSTGQGPARGRSLQREGPGDPITRDRVKRLLAYIEGQHQADRFFEAVSGVIISLIKNEADIAAALASTPDYTVDGDALARAWIQTIENRVRHVNDTTAEAIRSALDDALANGKTVDEVAREIDDIFGFADEHRSITIARTETIGASNYAAFETYRQLGSPRKRWLTVMDGRERPDHHDAHNQVVRITEPFNVGGYEMMYPGDPSAPADEVINCRCTLVPELSEEDQRSIWTQERLGTVWDSYSKRMNTWEGLLHSQMRLIFVSQHRDMNAILHGVDHA